MAVDGFPNMFMSLGPNSVIGTGILLGILEAAVMYAVQATAKMQRERLKSMEPKARAVRDFDRYIEVCFLVIVCVRTWSLCSLHAELLPTGTRSG